MSCWDRLFGRSKRMMEALDEDIRDFIARETQDNIDRGMAPEEARYAALRKFGNVTKIKEETRDVWTFIWLEQLWQDVRFGLRMLAKNPGIAAVAVLSLALGIGANSAIFSIVDAELLRPWPVKDPSHLVAIDTHWPKEPDFGSSSYPDYLDIRQQATAFSEVVASGDRGSILSGGAGRPGQLLRVEVVSQNYFAALDVKALDGRTFSPQPEQAAAESHAVVVSYNLWQRYFGGDRSLPGKSVLLDGREFTLIGVTPRDFCGLRQQGAPDIWVTTKGWETMIPGEAEADAARNYRWFDLVGRLQPGTPIGAAQAQLQTIARRLELASPATNLRVEFAARPATEPAHEGVATAIYLIAMVSLVLMISCANVANLLLAQNERRQREIALRRALGAGRQRLLTQLLTEGLLWALVSGVLGVLLAAWLIRLGPALVPGLRDENLKLDGRVLLFTTAISLLSAVVFGLAPALAAVKGDLTPTFKGTSQIRSAGRLPLRSALVCSEVALSVVLLAGSGLLLHSLLYSEGIHPGFNPKKNVVMLSVAPPTMYGYSDAQAAALYPVLAARAESVPGVVRASYSRRQLLTTDEGGETLRVTVPGVPPPAGADHFTIRYNIVAPKFFATVGAHLEKGRDFTPFDQPSTMPVLIVNEAMARKFWPGRDAVGSSVRIEKKDYLVAGVVENGRYTQLHEPLQPYIFLPFSQSQSIECVLFVETAGDPRSFLPAILKETAAVAKNLPIVSAETFKDHIQGALAGERGRVELLASLGFLGMFLAAVGLFATVSYVVSRQTREMGIRMALGARGTDVRSHVLANALWLSGTGAAIGVAGALVASRMMSQFIYGVTLTDPLSYAAAVLLAVGMAMLASYFPARRASKVDPTVALRYE